MTHADQDVIPYWTRKIANGLLKPGFVVLSLTLLLGGIPAVSRAQDPGQQQDAEAERVKVLKAADQLDMIETGYETTRVTIDNLKTQVTQLTQSQAQLSQENADLKTQLSAMQDELKHSEEVHAAEQKALLAQVAELIASSMSKSKAPHTKVPKSSAVISGTSTASPTPDPNAPYSPPTPTPHHEAELSHNDAGPNQRDAGPSLNENPPDPTLVGSGSDVVKPTAEKTTTPAAEEAPSPVPTVVEHGYNHVVAEGETLTEIARAYREQGVKVTVSDIRKANNLTSQSVLKVGQKLFIPRL